MKIYTNELSHMTNMAAMPIYGKTLKNLILQKQLTYDLVYASTTKVTNYDPGLTLTRFTSRSNLVT